MTTADVERSTAATVYLEGGAGDVPQENERQWQRYAIVPRTLSGVGAVDLTTEVCGVRVQTPVLAAASAWHGLWHREAEAATARGVRSAGSLLALSQASTLPPEEVAAVSGPYVQQLYVPRDRGLLWPFIERATDTGAIGLVVTVDQLPVAHEQPFRAGVAAARPDWQPWDYASSGGAPADSFKPSDIAEIVEATSLPVIVKGVLHPDDAAAAVSMGAGGVVVSNHGGRQFDGAVTPAEVLEAIVDEVGHQVPVYVDSGIRSGADVFRALSLGASAVFLGRPVLRALQSGGADGVARQLRAVSQELASIMQLSGVARPGDLHRGLVTDRAIR